MSKWERHWPKIALALVLVFVAGVRIRMLSMPLERDEGEFAYAGQLLLQGVPPYSQCYAMKLPGTYAAYAVMEGIFGQTPSGIHFGAMLVNLGGAILLYRIARRFIGSAGAAAAAATHALLTLSPSVYGLAAHASQFVIASALGGLLLLCQAVETGRARRFFLSGVCFGLAFLMKQPGAMFGIFGVGVLVWMAARDREHWKTRARQIGWLALGGAAPVAVTAFALWQAGVFARFWFWTFTYARVHGGEIGLAEGGRRIWYYLSTLADKWLWIAAGASLCVALFRKAKWRWLALWFVACSAAAVSAGLYFTEHYFVMIGPALGLLVGIGVDQLNTARDTWIRWMAPVVIAALFVTVERRHPLTFFKFTPDQAVQGLYRGNPFLECREIGLRIREDSPANATIAVIGSEPEIMFYARRKSATGYIYTYDFTERQPYAEAMQREMTEQVEKARPEYLIFVRDAYSWYSRKDARNLATLPISQWALQFAEQYYAPEGLALVRREPEYFWGKDAFNRPPQPEPLISIMRRK